MNTPAHMIFAAALFARPGRPAVTVAAVLGGALPDVPLMLMVGWSLWVRGVPARTVFDDYYFSPEWQAVFAIDHGFFFWGAALAAGLFLGAAGRAGPALTAFAGSGFLHALVDFFVHHDDARAQFWPLTDWKFRSPVSYYDPAHYGNIFGPVEILVCLILCAVLWRRFSGRPARVLIVVAALAEAAPGIMFALMFRGSGP